MQHEKPEIRCAIYTRKSTSNRLEAEVNSLTTQRDICSAYVRSQAYKAWLELPERYDDGGQPGGSLDRPALAALMRDIEKGQIDTVVVYKIDRLTRSLADFVRLIDLFEQRRITLVSVSQAFDTSDSMGRMVLNILLTFSQFEREMIGERVRDSLRARKRHGKFHGGRPPFGYQVENDSLVVDEHEAAIVRFMFDEFIKTERYIAVQRAIEQRNFKSSVKKLRKGGTVGGRIFHSSNSYAILNNPIYAGMIRGHISNYSGQHEPLISKETWEAASRVAKARKKPEPRAKETMHYLAKLMRDELGRPMYLDVQRKPDGRSFTYYSSTDARWTQEKMIRAYRTHAGRFDQLIDVVMTEFLRDRVRLRRALKELGLHGRELEKLAELGEEGARRFEQTPSEAKEELLHALIIGIELSRDHIDITIRPFEIRRFLAWNRRTTYHARPREWSLTDARSEFRVEISAVSNEKWSSVHFKPRPKARTAPPNPSLTRLIRSAEKAQTLMRENRELDIADLAKMMDVRVAQFGRLLQLNYLAPDIVAAILDGTQPEKLARSDLLSSNLPTDWALQRSLLGFPPLRKEIVKSNKGGMFDERDIKGTNALS